MISLTRSFQRSFGVKAVHAVDAAGAPSVTAVGERYMYLERPEPQELLTQANAILENKFLRNTCSSQMIRTTNHIHDIDAFLNHILFSGLETRLAFSKDQ